MGPHEEVLYLDETSSHSVLGLGVAACANLGTPTQGPSVGILSVGILRINIDNLAASAVHRARSQHYQGGAVLWDGLAAAAGPRWW